MCKFMDISGRSDGKAAPDQPPRPRAYNLLAALTCPEDATHASENPRTPHNADSKRPRTRTRLYATPGPSQTPVIKPIG
ncbi:MAG: hypothetical protein OXU20_16845 [Myxococcales bacterium]|nr:hypothetical protein [Myxococcales bacterium]